MMMMMMFAFQSSGYNAFAFAQNQSSYLAGMNFSKSQDVYSKNGFLNTTLVAESHQCPVHYTTCLMIPYWMVSNSPVLTTSSK